MNYNLYSNVNFFTYISQWLKIYILKVPNKLMIVIELYIIKRTIKSLIIFEA